MYIFEQSIDQIHGKFQHYPITHEYDNLTAEDNSYILKFDNKSIEYKCAPDALIENLMGIKNVRDYRSLIEGYNEKYILKCILLLHLKMYFFIDIYTLLIFIYSQILHN